jgi:5-hydroxyisourate hydrolase
VADPQEQPRHTISTHVLDTERGVPAIGVHVTLYRLDVADAPIRMTQALTDSDGRVRDLLERPIAVGDYRLEFDVAHEDGSFFTRSPWTCASAIRTAAVPLLLAPYSMTTYRGS